jgi:intermediate peptidase
VSTVLLCAPSVLIHILPPIENVQQFLDTLLDHTCPHARQALQALSLRKQAHLKSDILPVIQAWDRDFYCPPELPAPPIPLPPLTLGTVFQALSRLFQSLYGVTLRPVELSPGEVWHRDVEKLEVVDETDGLLGWIYTDLFARPNKSSGAAHYTVRCSRRTDDDDAAGDILPAEDHRQVVDVSRKFEAGGQRRFAGGTFQLPVVVLLTEFSRPPLLSQGPAVLEWHEVLTLFHEMGHAMHCMTFLSHTPLVYQRRLTTTFLFHSHDRSYRISERLRHALRHRLCRAALYPNGTLPHLSTRPRALRRARHRHRP